MGERLVYAVLAAGLLAFYSLAFGLARLPLLQRKPRLLLVVHLSGWGLALLLLGVFVKWHISLRGQWLDSLPFGVAWLAAGSYFWLRRPQLRGLARLYFGGWFAYPVALVLAYAADKIFFVLVSLPLLIFFPTTTYYSSSVLAIRGATGGFLAPFRVQLLESVGGVWERHLGLADDYVLDWKTDSIIAARRLPSLPSDSVTVLVRTRSGQRRVRFGR